MGTIIEAPRSGPKVTVMLPKALFNDSRNSESSIQVKRTMLGRTITYVNETNRVTLQLPLRITRQKSLELEAFIQIYQSAEWLVTLHDGSQWAAKLIGQPVTRETIGRIGGTNTTLTGKEMITVTLTLSCERLN